MSERIHVEVKVVLTEKEYIYLRRKAALMASGTVGEAVRQEMSMPGLPHGHTKAPVVATEKDYMQFYFDGKDA